MRKFWTRTPAAAPSGTPAPAPQQPEPRRELAVPLLPAEATKLIEILHEAERLPDLDKPRYAQTSSGRGWAMHLAEIILSNAGIASTLGHDTVPLIKYHLDQVGNAVQILERLLADKDYAGQCRLLHAKLVANYGVAKVHGWTVDHDPAEGDSPLRHSETYRWSADIPAAHDTAMPRLLASQPPTD